MDRCSRSTRAVVIPYKLKEHVVSVSEYAQSAGTAAQSQGPIEPRADTRDGLGRPLRDLRLSVIDQCNFRCAYCMPKEVFGNDYPFLSSSALLSFEQMVKMAKAFTSLGVEKIRITGGEPLLRRNLETLIEKLATLKTTSGKPVEVALTTNGSLLGVRARALRNAGLSRVTVSLDSVDDAIFRRMSGVHFPVTRILDGIDAALAAGLAPVKVNAVIERGVNESQILPIAHRFRGTGVIVRFIEYMDVGGASAWAKSKVLASDEAREIVESAFPLVSTPPRRANDTAVSYKYADGKGEVGFVSSMSSPFCGSCSRVRVSADGQMYNCLFATHGMDLKPWLSDAVCVEEISNAIRVEWHRRMDRYSELRDDKRKSGSGKAYPTVRMSLVGG
ncbi:cyclic pyranopterin phosphate synthase [Paraburkholderia youngii]